MNRLLPKPGQPFLNPEEVVKRVRDEFGYADADWDEGDNGVGNMIALFLRRKEGYARWKDPPPHAAELDEIIARLGAVRHLAVMLTFGDDRGSEYACVDVLVVPNEHLIIGYSCGQHEDEATPLVHRLAAILQYDLMFE